ncbi:MAG: sigma-70 family RNA polymerase sigma factor [Acidobacteriia bacterium]|nr:sigma-70 family RNA polymerase sigma factor [Terriglobia bacterium]
MNSDTLSPSVSQAGSDLVRRAQRGDADAFATLFHTHKTRVYSLCLRMTNNVAEAEDLAQDAFLQVFRKLATFRGDSTLSTWLYRITVNTVLMHFRRKSPCRVSLDEPVNNAAGTRSTQRQYGTRDGRLETSVARVALTRAISELPEGYRAIFLLHEIEGYQHREIAELLGCSIGTSKSQLHKAKLRIREILSDLSQGHLGAKRDVLRENERESELAREKWELPGKPQPSNNNGSIPDFLPSNA